MSYEKQIITSPDCVVGHSFGTSIGEGSVNCQLGRMMMDLSGDLPTIADRTLVNALNPAYAKQIDYVVEGPVMNNHAKGLGAWGAWLLIKQHMQDEGLKRPLVIAQSHHLERVIKQGARLGIKSDAPEKLPSGFDPNSEQFWTRSLTNWTLCRLPIYVTLKYRGQI